MITCKVQAQNTQTLEITDKLLDSLSIYPQLSQLTIQSDLYYQLFLEKYPNTHEAYMSRSVPYNKTGEHAIGFAMLNRAVELAPIENLGYRAFVKLYMMHDYEGALQDGLRLDSITSYAKPGVWGEDMDMVIGLCYLQLNDLKNARLRLSNSINEVTKKNGKEWNSPRVFLYLGITLMKEKAYPEAIQVLDELIQMNPNYSEAYYYKAQCYSALKDLKNAEVSIEKCKSVYGKYGAERNPYFELPYQIYPSFLSKGL
ncbi:MAG: tetratricopeptide repeat protein [Bacteroidia bacterium]|jgi:tetratricopeptide (TPR) repeat protein|nr:tetratricopeptide repeat protein [Bacteroidia bacterium]